MLGRIVNEDSSRKRRRSVVTLMYLAILCVPGMFLCWGFVPRDLEPGRWFAPMLALVFLLSTAISSLILMTFFALRASTHEIADKKDAILDERQLVVRNGAYRTAYNLLCAAVVYSFLFAQVVGWDRISSWLPQKVVITAVSYTFLWLALTLPTAIVAWREPDPAPDE